MTKDSKKQKNNVVKFPVIDKPHKNTRFTPRQRQILDAAISEFFKR